MTDLLRPFEPQSIAIDGHNIAYCTAGDPDAPPIVLAHGWLSYRGVWRQTMDILRRDYFCVAMDHLGFGESDKPPDGDYSIDAHGRRVLMLADKLGIEQAIFVGHSMGGQIVVDAAARLCPPRVTKLVSVSGVISGCLMPFVRWFIYPGVFLSAYLPGFHALARYLVRYRAFARLYMGYPWFYQMSSVPYELWALDRQMAFQPEVAIPALKSGLSILATNLIPCLPNIHIPTLSIFGKQDRCAPCSEGWLLDEYVPDSELTLIDSCGHFPMYEQFDQYFSALQGFLSN